MACIAGNTGEHLQPGQGNEVNVSPVLPDSCQHLFQEPSGVALNAVGTSDDSEYVHDNQPLFSSGICFEIDEVNPFIRRTARVPTGHCTTRTPLFTVGKNISLPGISAGPQVRANPFRTPRTTTGKASTSSSRNCK
jgi:hypothetical protein